jgi:hypothetical protein
MPCRAYPRADAVRPVPQRPDLLVRVLAVSLKMCAVVLPSAGSGVGRGAGNNGGHDEQQPDPLLTCQPADEEGQDACC